MTYRIAETGFVVIFARARACKINTRCKHYNDVRDYAAEVNLHFRDFPPAIVRGFFLLRSK